MPKIEAAYNAIVTPSRITLGRGHDGATGGKPSVTIFTGSSIVKYVVPTQTANAFTADGEQTFVEIVGESPKLSLCGAERNTAYVVQVRSGHEPKGANVDFIPEDTIVQRIHVTDENTDLLAWQQLAATFTKGDVIYAASLSCHGAVHGVANNVPVITSHMPEKGELLRAGAVSQPDYKRIAKLIESLISENENLSHNKVLFGWKLLHLLPYNLQAGNEIVIAYALFYLLLGGIAGCLGEYRHKKGTGRVKGFPKKGTASRNDVFTQVFKNKRQGFELIYRVWSSFYRTDHWPSSGFGGKKWAECTSETIFLQRNIAAFLRKPTAERLAKCIEQGNVLAHCQHNGGLLFDKFGASSENVGDLAANGSVVLRLLDLLDRNPQDISLHPETLKAMVKPTPKIVKFFRGELTGKELEKWESMEKSKLAKKLIEQKKAREKAAAQAKIEAEQYEAMKKEQEKLAKAKKEKFASELAKYKFQFRILKEEGEYPGFLYIRLQTFGEKAEFPYVFDKFQQPEQKMIAETGVKIPVTGEFASNLKLQNEVFNSKSGANTNAVYCPVEYVSHTTNANNKLVVTFKTPKGLTFESEVN